MNRNGDTAYILVESSRKHDSQRWVVVCHSATLTFSSVDAVFCFLRGDISENIDQNTTELLEEMGVQTDEDVNVSYEAFSKLQAKKRRV